MAEFIKVDTGEPLHVDFTGFRVDVRRRDVDADGGITIGLSHPSGDSSQELIRFDVFREDPHYHVPASNPKQIDLDTKSYEESLEFALHCLAKRLPELLRQADFPELADAIDPNEMSDVAERVRAATDAAPEPSSTQLIEVTPALREQLGQQPPG